MTDEDEGDDAMRQVVWAVALCGALVGACGRASDGAATPGAVDVVEPAARVEVASAPVGAASVAGALGDGDVAVGVTWHDGTPAEGVNVGLADREANRATLRWGVTDADGRFVWRDVPTGRFLIVTDRLLTEPVDREAPGPVEAELSIPDSADIAITVVDSEGEPVRDATVTTSGFLEARAHVVATTDARGECVVRDLLGHVEARAPGYGPSSVEFGRGALRLVLADTARRLSGRIVDPYGAPIAGAVVTVRRSHFLLRLSGPDFVTARQTTDETGRVALDALPAESAELRVEAEGFAPLSVDVDLRDADTTLGDLTLARGWRLHGVVTDEHGEPVTGARVGRGGIWSRDSTRTDAEGAYRLVDLPVRWDNAEEPLHVEHPDYVDTTHRDGPSFVSGPDVEWNPVLAIGGTIRGVVVDGDGSPVARAFVAAIPAGADRSEAIRGSVASDGRFALAGVADGEYSVEVRVSGRRGPVAVVRGVRAGDELRVEVVEAGSLVGRVESVSGEFAAVSLKSADDSFPRGHVRLEQDGRFEFGDVNPGDYILDFLGFEAPPTVDVSVRPGEVTDVGLIAISVTPDTPGSVSVRLVAADDALFDRVAVHLRKRGDSSWPRVRPASDGAHVFEDVDPGDYDVAIVATEGGIAEAVLPVTVESGGQSEVVHVLERGGRVDVRAEWSTSSRGPDPRAVIEVRDAAGAIVYREVDEAYRTVLEDFALNLVPGRHTIEIVDEAARSGWATFDVRLDEVVEVFVEVR